MARFIVEGGTPLRGEITAKGNKNSALPLIAASLLTNEPVILRNLPRIRDVTAMLEIVSGLGATVDWLDPQSVKICTADVKRTAIDPKLSREIRTSLLVAGPMLARFKKVTLGPPGGDVIGRRRSDTHWLALQAFGATVSHDRAGFGLEATELAGADVLLDEQSVTATENALLCAVLAPGRTVIRNAASEPHVQELSMVLVQMGARVHGIGTNTLEIRGVPTLNGVDHEIWSDHMEVGSFMGLAAMTHGELTVQKCAPQHLAMIRAVFKRLGVDSSVDGDELHVPAKDRYKNEADHWEIAAQGTHRDGPVNLNIGFTFDTKAGGLKCILYNADGQEAALVKGMMIKRYGPPAKESSLFGAQSLTWTKPDKIEFVMAQKPVAATVTQCAP